ncbi:MAG: site-specific DNA-methyltransferase [Armatimonadetes bacterium]|nr:site-specific DNA-methyltransferase [Armatimonadota bacterium]
MIHLWQGDCLERIERLKESGITVDLTFLDPPFNQGKEYACVEDDLPEEEYWKWMHAICQATYENTTPGGAIYFMQREKNAEATLHTLRETGWVFQNLIIWLKKTSAVPGQRRFGKQFQIITFATKGKPARHFHRLRIDPPKPPNHKIPRENGIFVTDCWDDIREMTSGYLAGDEALRDKEGARLHKQQAPIALLRRILLSSTKPGDWTLDPCSGTGTTAVVADQLGRNCVAIEIDPNNVGIIDNRLKERRAADSICKHRVYYRYTPNLEESWNEQFAAQWYRENKIVH